MNNIAAKIASHYETNQGGLLVLTGAMKTDKTRTIVSILEKLTNYSLFREPDPLTGTQAIIIATKPKKDAREQGITDRTGSSCNIPVYEISELSDFKKVADPAQIIFCEEFQFYPPETMDYIKETMRTKRKIFVVSTLNQDFRGEPFAFQKTDRHIGELLAIGETITFTGLCDYKILGLPCSQEATRSLRIKVTTTGRSPDQEGNEIGGGESYEEDPTKPGEKDLSLDRLLQKIGFGREWSGLLQVPALATEPIIQVGYDYLAVCLKHHVVPRTEEQRITYLILRMLDYDARGGIIRDSAVINRSPFPEDETRASISHWVEEGVLSTQTKTGTLNPGLYYFNDKHFRH